MTAKVGVVVVVSLRFAVDNGIPRSIIPSAINLIFVQVAIFVDLSRYIEHSIIIIIEFL